ncbi:MAG: C40 family peptidase [Chitinophagaceae bacterium]|nr:C40 family peptidase [Chitinophagaceae bacterium]
MLEFIEEWYGTPYRYGGTSKQGVDCSAFVNFFMSAVYGLSVPRNSKEQYSAAKKIKKKQLEEGDLVFFNTRGGVSHVGVYLGNNKFAHASTSSGVTISDLDDDYYDRRYVGSGRVR